MTLELSSLFIGAVIYLAILFLIAYATDRGSIPQRWVSHPLTYTLSLGVYATSWTYYGSVGFAHSSGFQFLTIYLGVTLAFVLSPVLLRPILRLTQEYQLSSLADLFAFRYRSQLAGILVTLFMLMGTLPYIALQIRAVTQSMQVLTDEAPPHILALGFCITLTIFAILFGARHISPREKHTGLVVAIAFESLVKLLALLAVGLFALFGVFDGPQHLSSWLSEHPQAVSNLYQPVEQNPWFTLIMLSFAAAFLLPRQFHMLFAENLNEAALKTASWSFPLFLLLLNLFIPVILWAGNYQQLSMDPDYFALGITLQQGSTWMPLLTFIGGISAASAMVIVTTLALSSMCLNHLLLPASYPDPQINLYYWLLWGRRFLIGTIILAGYSFYAFLEHREGLVQLGLISFVAVAQFLPGIVGLLYWRRATGKGFIAGLLGGILVWVFTLLVPVLHNSSIIDTDLYAGAIQQASGMDHWSFATFWSLALNGLLFSMVSLLTKQNPGELEASQACCSNAFTPLKGIVAASSVEQFRANLADILGNTTAENEVNRALEDLQLSSDESHPAELRRLRERIERNLYGLIGPQLSHVIVNRKLALDANAKTALVDSMRYVEDKLEHSRSLLDGLSMELDNLRRYQRQILLDLPLGVCAISQDFRVVIWNPAMEDCSNVAIAKATGSNLQQLPHPWGEILSGFARAADDHIHNLEITLSHRPHWFNLHKAVVEETEPVSPSASTGMVILVEDITQMENLEAELTHSDRLASIGRLAAGVAHEIGNPLTGIACLAQNLRYESDSADVRKSATDILVQTRRIANIVKSLTNFSRTNEVVSYNEPVKLCEIIQDALELVQLTHKDKQIKFRSSCPGNLSTKGDRQRLSQVFVNLLTNAGDASEGEQPISITAEQDNQQIIIRITDRGSGIPEGFKSRLFEPFATTKPTGEGTGLGLALARNIILDHHGQIEIDSRETLGTRVTITLPTST
jgi:Na+/proline symporter/signal transduction histidine kinase